MLCPLRSPRNGNGALLHRQKQPERGSANQPCFFGFLFEVVSDDGTKE